MDSEEGANGVSQTEGILSTVVRSEGERCCMQVWPEPEARLGGIAGDGGRCVCRGQFVCEGPCGLLVSNSPSSPNSEEATCCVVCLSWAPQEGKDECHG